MFSILVHNKSFFLSLMYCLCFDIYADEALRIKSSNGRVFALRDEPGAPRAWLPRVYSPGMAMSRCFGDFVMKNYGIISDPVITHHHITSDDQFILLATDGVCTLT